MRPPRPGAVRGARAATRVDRRAERPNLPGTMIRFLLVAALFLVPAAPALSFRITDPWPDAEAVRGVREVAVTLRSRDPFTPAAIAGAPARAVGGRLFLPPGARPNGATPAVVMLHGSGGMIADRVKYGPQLAAMGIAVLLVETYDSRRDLAAGFIERVLNITETMFVADAYAALRHLAARPEIDPGRVVLVGFSYGAMATVYASYAQMADAFAPGGPRFAGHVAYYGPCIAGFDDNRTTGAPVLLLNGAQDELTPPDRCARLADEVRAGGSPVELVSYPGAVHQWDGGLPRMLVGRQLAGCRFRVGRDGTVRDENTGLPMSGPFLRKLILGLCTEGRLYPIGRDDTVRARSNRDFGAFLIRVFGSAGG